MNRLLLSSLLFALLAAPLRAEEARWIRYPALSPDGTKIVFGCRGDLWVVPREGGEARPLTTHVGYEKFPIWSPDSKRIAFASDRHGNFDLFYVSADGGQARRLTYHSATDRPACFSRDGERLLFTSSRQDAPQASLGSTFLSELYSVPLEGGRPKQLCTTPTEAAQLSPDGRHVAYHDLKGYENYWRKHHVSSVARDVWIWNLESGAHKKITAFRGEDRNPVWAPGGRQLFFLSERAGSFNVWMLTAPFDGEPVQITKHTPHPVRFLSAADDGTLCYGYNGELWLRPKGGESRRVVVTVRATERQNAERPEVLRKGATDFSVSPSGKEIAFVVRGEVFVASVEHGTTRRVTATPTQERSVDWAQDGRTIYYAAERDGSWNLFKTSLQRKEEKHFFFATLLKEEPVLVGPDETFQPVLSPGGRRIAYLHNRDEIRVLDLRTGKTKTVVPAHRNYSYADGDIDYEWSPDGKWLAFSFLGDGRWIDDVGVANVASGEIVNMTRSGYDEYRPRWSPDGKALLFYSNRLGRRAHGSWGSEGDVFAIYLTPEAYDKAKLTPEEYELEEEDEEDGDDEEDGTKEKRRRGRRKKRKPVEPVKIEFEGREKRIRRLTLHSAPLAGYAMSPDGEKLVYFARIEEKWDLWINEIRKASTKRLVAMGADQPGEVEFDEEGETLFVRRGDGVISKVELKRGGESKAKKVPYGAEMTIHAPNERAYIFDHVWRQLKRKFYEPSLHGVAWDGLRRNYVSLLPHITNNHDFAELLSEMLGELNASHTGARFRVPQDGADTTASLGLLFDPAHEGDGLKVSEVLENGPADLAGDTVPPGAILVRIDGQTLPPTRNPFVLLNRKAKKPTLLTFTTPDGKTLEKVVKPIGGRAERNLLYKRWTKQRAALVEELSKGRIGYVHVRGMNDRSFRHVFQEVLGKHGMKAALVVDTRYNGGGWLHDDLVKFLGGEPYALYHPRGKERGALGGEPRHRWARPVAVVQNESNYSDAHVFPYAFKQLGIGKLVGTPVAGTGTAVWWERQIDPTLVFGIPQVGLVTPDGKYLENLELQPDIEVYNDPVSVAQGRDRQLEHAVQVLLEQVGTK